MTKISTIKVSYVDVIPAIVDDGVLYISTSYGTAVHKCCCGCEREVVTPLGPTDWSVTVDSGAVTVHPSIGNWSFPCKSHYWIADGVVRWAEQWSEAQIKYGRYRDRLAKQSQYDVQEAGQGFWTRVWRFFAGR